MESPADSDMRKGTPVNERSTTENEVEMADDADVAAPNENDTRDVSISDANLDEEPVADEDAKVDDPIDVKKPMEEEQPAAANIEPSQDDIKPTTESTDMHQDNNEENTPINDDINPSEEDDEDDNYGPDPNDRITATADGIPLSTPNDMTSLSPLLTFIRSSCVEYFTAKLEEEGSPQKGRRAKIVEGTVGIRCVFCKELSLEKRGRQNMAFPTGLDTIFSAVVMWQCRHVSVCKSIPRSTRLHLKKLKQQGRAGVNVDNNHWVDSAKEKGLMDTDQGIMFESVDALERALEGANVCREIGGEIVSSLGEVDGSKATTATAKERKKREGVYYTDVETPRRSAGTRWSVRKGRGGLKQDDDDDEGDQGGDGGISGRRGRTKRSTTKFDNESEADDVEIQEEEGDTWKCGHCGAEHPSDKKRCSGCKHFRKGCGPGRKKDQIARSPSPEAKPRSASRGRRSASATPVQIRGKRGQVEDSAEGEWECCGEVYPSERRRCSECKRWRNGSCRSVSPTKRTGKSPANAIDEQYGEFPPGIEIGTPKGNQCKVSGCIKRAQGGNDGLCRTHYNSIVRDRRSSTHWTCECGQEVELLKSRCTCYKWRGGVKGGKAKEDLVMEEEETVPQDARSKHKSPGNKCRIPGCNKFKQFNCDDMCYRHHRQSTAKYDSVEEAKKKTPSPTKATRSSSKPVDSNVRRSRSGRAVNPSPKVRYRDDDSDFSPEALPSKSRGTKRTRDDEEKSDATRGKKPKSSLFCMHEGCTRHKQSGCSGYCCAHSHTIQQYRDMRKDKKNNANQSSDASPQVKMEEVANTKSPAKKKAELSEEVVNPKSPAKKKAEITHTPPISKSSAEHQVNRLDSGKSVISNASKSAKTDNCIKIGDMVQLLPSGALARVVKVNLTDSSENMTYDLMKIFGGREQAVEGGRLSVYRTGSVFSPQLSDLLKRDAPQFKNTTAMLEMTRYKLLSGQDCWICTSCSVIVPSLTMICGVCKRYPSFVPLEMNEFKDFVRGQRKKQNQLWLRKEMPDTRSEVSKHLCKLQGCVQPSQISHNGYCETHMSAGVLVRKKDLDQFSDFFCFLYQQMEPIVFTEDDALNPRDKDRDIGEPGIACRHCKGRRSFPRGVEALRQKTFTMALFRHMTECKQCPQETKVILMRLQAKGKEKDDATTKTGSNRQFLVRIWNRLQRLSSPEFRVCRLQGCKEIAKNHCDGLCDVHRTVARLVLPHDHSVIQDFACLVFEQMQPCNLIDSDKKDGLHMDMENGAPGLECRHCIGSPDHFRFFPSNKAHLNEIGAVGLFLAHMRNCTKCPEKVRSITAECAFQPFVFLTLPFSRSKLSWQLSLQDPKT
ncbi:hypothetical protein ACHAWO_000589 [Cyclotella atomus]|uniref:RanBP2-type domain-containing protein n=1 Tax=Cyclotella atomus TaxID=382360 RepID=A0ABD3NP23_9STRA